MSSRGFGDLRKSPGPDSTDSPASFSARLLHANNYNLASAFQPPAFASLIAAPPAPPRTPVSRKSPCCRTWATRACLWRVNPNKVSIHRQRGAAFFRPFYELPFSGGEAFAQRPFAKSPGRP
ncbi:hypothetical protein E0198_002957 [Clavispora lusitaniae]|nr:hypothetical protein E0198_002957 [Clavispora lusitaniae]